MALDDSINNKCGRKIFGSGFFHDHTAKLNQPSYPWSQNIVAIGLLKIVKGRWSCLPLATTITWIYADRISADPERRHIVKGRTSFAFSDVRRLIANTCLSEDFLRLWPFPLKSPNNSFVSLLLRMVA